MFGFVLGLLVVGGLGTLVAIGDPQGARLAPYLGFTGLFAGLGALLFSASLAAIGYQLIGSEPVGSWGLFVGYVLGGIAGAAAGFLYAFRRQALAGSGV
jgi:hypothetical protein